MFFNCSISSSGQSWRNSTEISIEPKSKLDVEPLPGCFHSTPWSHVCCCYVVNDYRLDSNSVGRGRCWCCAGVCSGLWDPTSLKAPAGRSWVLPFRPSGPPGAQLAASALPLTALPPAGLAPSLPHSAPFGPVPGPPAPLLHLPR